MSDSTYVGDSPGKKLARSRLWVNGAGLMSSLGIPFAGAFVLAGEGGDLSVLDGLKFDLSKVTAVDRDGDYTWLCKGLYPDVIACEGEADDWCEVSDYNAVHLDFCNGLTVENIVTLATVARNAVGPAAMIGVTMMKGREAPAKNMPLLMDLPRGIRRAILKDRKRYGNYSGNQMLTGGTFSPELEIGIAKNRLRDICGSGHPMTPYAFKKNGNCTPLGNGMARIDALRQCANTLLIPYRRELISVSVYCYHSKSRHTGGTPFVTSMLIAASQDAVPSLQDRISRCFGSQLVFDSMSAQDSYNNLKPSVLDMCRHLPSSTVAKMFDVDEKTVVAWKAHETRGTYSGSKGSVILKIKESPSEAMSKPMSFGWGMIRVLVAKKSRALESLRKFARPNHGSHGALLGKVDARRAR